VDDFAKYEFDRLGYLVLPELLAADEVASLREAAGWLIDRAFDELATHGHTRRSEGEEQLVALDEEHGYEAQFGPLERGGEMADGKSLFVPAFLNAHEAFDTLVNHPGTMDVVRDAIVELRVRFRGDSTPAHFGGHASSLFRYSFGPRGIDCAMVRMVYFLHTVTADQGALAVVPATHKSNWPSSPYEGYPVDDEPGMVPVEVEAGDAVFFTENLRHGGLTNRSDQARVTLHVGYGPSWMTLLTTANPNHGYYVRPRTLERLRPDQRALLAPLRL
jgi:ectoine hydroxylase-related dioxygenase (phytanoyl-CoA dioxygenase family)